MCNIFVGKGELQGCEINLNSFIPSLKVIDTYLLFLLGYDITKYSNHYKYSLIS